MKKLFGFLLLAAAAGLISIGSFAQRNNSNEAWWPQWRGPFFNGMARGDAPVAWSATENIKWKTPIPGRGHSTPVIWGDRIFLTTAIPTGPPPAPVAAPDPSTEQGGRRGRRSPGGGDGPQQEHKFEVICINRRTGAVMWQRTAKAAVPHEGYHRTYGSFASNSPITDGKNGYVSFGSRGVYCYDLNGKLVWSKDLGVQMRIRLQFGEGSWPVLDGDALVLNFDHDGGNSFIIALDKNTGKELWRTNRDEQSSWSGPLVVQHGAVKQVIITASNKVRSYDLRSGKLIWECAGLGSNTIPSPVVQNQTVYVMSGHRNPKLMAIKLGREGDITGTDAVLWTRDRALSYTASPILYENKLYILTDQGMLSCLNAATGEPYYQQVRLPKPYSFKASPVGANGKLYLATEDGDVVIVKMGEKYEVMATNTITDERFISSPVIADGELFLRGTNHLYCISDKKPSTAK